MKRHTNYGPWLTLLATVLLLSACGIKPGHLDPPPGSDPNEFPRTYPSK